MTNLIDGTKLIQNLFCRLLGIGLIVTSGCIMAGCATSNPQPAQPAAHQGLAGQTDIISPDRQNEIIEKWGIKIERVNFTANNLMIDLRYRVLNANKAGRIINHRNKPVLIDEKSGNRFIVPRAAKVGIMRHTGNRLINGRVYTLLFANPGRYIKPGSRITLEIGDLKIQHLPV